MPHVNRKVRLVGNGISTQWKHGKTHNLLLLVDLSVPTRPETVWDQPLTSRLGGFPNAPDYRLLMSTSEIKPSNLTPRHPRWPRALTLWLETTWGGDLGWFTSCHKGWLISRACGDTAPQAAALGRGSACSEEDTALERGHCSAWQTVTWGGNRDGISSNHVKHQFVKDYSFLYE